MTDVKRLEQQLIELQSQLAFQDDTMATLNEALASQQREILMLREQVTLLKQRQDEQGARLTEGGMGESLSAAEEKPPHY